MIVQEWDNLLIVVAILSPSSQMSAWAAVVSEPGYSITLLNDELAGPVELDLDSDDNILVANEGAPGVFAYEDFVSKLDSDGVTLEGEFIDGLEGAAGVAVDEIGNIYVSQDLALRLRKYDSTGALVFEFQHHRPEFTDPNSLTLTQDGRLLASVQELSTSKWLILAFDTETGARLGAFSQASGFVHARGLAKKGECKSITVWHVLDQFNHLILC